MLHFSLIPVYDAQLALLVGIWFKVFRHQITARKISYSSFLVLLSVAEDCHSVLINSNSNENIS